MGALRWSLLAAAAIVGLAGVLLAGDDPGACEARTNLALHQFFDFESPAEGALEATNTSDLAALLRAVRSAVHDGRGVQSVLSEAGLCGGGGGAIDGAGRLAQLLATLRRAKAVEQCQAPPRVVVAGGGPVGLLAAVTAAQYGANVTLVDKRPAFLRNIWFDLTGRGYDSPSLSVLQRLGFTVAGVPVVHHPGFRDVVTVRCQVLQRFLSRVAVVLGVDVRLGVAVEGVGPGTRAVVEGDTPLASDVLIVADGAKSKLRRNLSIPSSLWQDVRPVLGRETVFVVDGLHQASVLAVVAPVNGTCPPLAPAAGGDALDPYAATVPGVHSVFKRWFPPYCELQLLLTQAVAGEVLGAAGGPATMERSLAAHSAAWDLLDGVLGVVLRGDMVPEVVSARVLRLETRVAAQHTLVRCDGEACGLVMLRGDASITPHYRLGIGINSAIAGIGDVSQAVLQWRLAHPDLAGFAAATEAGVVYRVEAQAWAQAHAMYHEGYCRRAVHGGDVYVWDTDAAAYALGTPRDVAAPCAE